MSIYTPELTKKIISNIFEDNLVDSSSNIKNTVKSVKQYLSENNFLISEELILAISSYMLSKNINNVVEVYNRVKTSSLQLESFLIDSYKDLREDGVAAIGGSSSAAKPVQDVSSIAKIDAPMDKNIIKRIKKKQESDSKEILE